jgi:hypothetical protein
MLCRNSQKVSSEVRKVRGSGAPKKMLKIELFYSCAISYMQKKVESMKALLMCLERGVGSCEIVGRGINNMNFLFINVSGFCCVLSMDNILCTVPYGDMAAVLTECTKEHSL